MTGMMALVGFTAWALLLVAVVVSWRVVEVLRGKPANSWTRGTAVDQPSFVKRAEHAHLNTLENLPIFAAIVLVAQALGKTGPVDTVAAWILYARLAQSITHLIGVSHWLVLIRATFYTVQLALFAYLLWGLAA